MKPLKEIPPNPPRWEPSTDPASIHIPNLDTSASVNDQIEQIEQLITLKLQNIDANFSKMQQVMSSRILPAFKRYAVATEPVRDAAKFWMSFYEAAAQVRLPTYDDLSEAPSADQTQAQTGEEDGANTTVREQQPDETFTSAQPSSSMHHPSSLTFDPDHTPSESSFMPGQGAITSTPAGKRHGDRDPHATFDSDPSFSGTIDSPLVRLDRDIRNFSLDDDPSSSRLSLAPPSPSPTDRPSYADDEGEETVHAPSFADKGKGKARRHSHSLREDVLHATLSPHRTRAKPKTAVPADRNPYLPSGTRPRDWSGVVDLRDPNIATPHQDRDRTYASSRKKTPAPPARDGLIDDEDDDDENWLPPDMSPPRMVPFKPVPALNIGRSPRKDAAARIGSDLVRTARLPVRPSVVLRPGPDKDKSKGKGGRAGASAAESSLSSTAPSVSPPSLSDWRHGGDTSTDTAANSTIESLLRRVKSYGEPRRPEEEAASSFASAASSTLPMQHPLPAYYTPDAHGSGIRSESESVASSQAKEYSGQEQAYGRERAHEQPPPPARAGPAPVFAQPAATTAAPIYKPPAQAYRVPLPEPTPITPQPAYLALYGADINANDYDEDPNASLDNSFDEEPNSTAHPSAAFLLASANRHLVDSDDSFDSEDSSAGEDMDVSLEEPVHPFARAAMHAQNNNNAFSDDEEDSFGESELLGDVGATATVEETVFGLPPAQRAARESEVLGPGGRLRMMGADRVGGDEVAEAGWPMESPTPYGSGDVANYGR